MNYFAKQSYGIINMGRKLASCRVFGQNIRQVLKPSHLDKAVYDKNARLK